MIQKRKVQLDSKEFITEKSLSEYSLESPMTKDEIVVGIEIIRSVFNINENALDLMCTIMAEELWSLRKLKDAVKYVLKTHKYKEVKPADILSYDRGIKFYGYHEMIALGQNRYVRVYIPGLPNMIENKSEPHETKDIDAGWWVEKGQVLPESWQL